jgi:metallo-beta-lactamase family protein
MPLQIKFHGALGEVTGSTSFLKLVSSGSVYAVDCGSAHKREVLHEPAHPDNLPAGCKPGQLKGLFLTHAHADHIGMLLYWVKAGFRGPIYCTTETARFAFIACEDSLRILLRENPKADVGEAEKASAQKLLEDHVPLTPEIEVQVEPGLAVICYPTSHIVGCVGFQFSSSDASGAPRRVFFTGDVGTVEDETEACSMMRTRVRPKLPSDYVVTESTYGDKERSGDRSGKARLARMAEVLERGFRHGGQSKLIFPAFSLQRSQDILMDIYQVLSFNRAATGLASRVVPKVYLDSSLASSFMSVFRDVYRDGAAAGNHWVNPAASFFGDFAGDRAEIDLTLEKLLRFETVGACVRLYVCGEAMEVFSGPLPGGAQGPSIVICGSGMTKNGAIQRYLYDYVEDPFTTFVISGYVPPRSPGHFLAEIARMTAEVRATMVFDLKEDEKRNLPKKSLFASDIKSGCFSISDFYSGHADGPSICRYVLGTDIAENGLPKRVFLTHGEQASRAGLTRLMEARFDSLRSAGVKTPIIECPNPLWPWFDCGGDRWMEEEVVTTSLSVLVPASDDILNVALSVYDPAEIQLRQGQGILRRRANLAHSTTNLRVKSFSASHRKLIAETTYGGGDSLLEAGRVAFRWREVLNALQLQKSEYFAGHKLCATEQEFQEFERMRRNLILDGRQRLHGFVVAGKEAFAPEEISALESLLTPHVPFYVLDDQYLCRLNAALFADPDQPKLSKTEAYYVPLKLSDPFVPISRPFGWECLRNLLRKVAADEHVKSTRQLVMPSLSSRASRPVSSVGMPVEPAEGIPAERAVIPAEAYAALRIGDKVAVHVEAPFVNGKAKGMKLRVEKTRALGVIYGSNYIGGVFEHPVGAKIEVYVRMVDAPMRKAEFVLIRPMFNEGAVRLLGSSTGMVTWRQLADLIPCDVKRLPGLVGDYCKLCVDDYLSITPEKLVPAGSEAEIYETIVRGLALEKQKRTSLPPVPEPFTVEKMSRIIGVDWRAIDVLAAATYFKASTQEKLVEMAEAILAHSPAGQGQDVFPLEYKDLFHAACIEAAAARWAAVPVVRSEAPARPLPAPSYHVLRELASVWGLSPEALVLEAEHLGIELRSDTVLTVGQAARLSSGVWIGP